jgi:hypothetical protein
MTWRGNFGRAIRLVKRSNSAGPTQAKANLSQGQLCSEVARLEEQNGFPFTAALKWREAAQLFGQNTESAELCWREWERIMGLSRQRAFPAEMPPLATQAA